ncbi:hypothetical protein ACIRP7_13925 [Streptomyces sp. NPDC102270]|uniref:hypothetical protein n=1 Tax=Streptomyces sp. NPDC102270 TaxID=3366150 RepID=UPI003830D825
MFTYVPGVGWVFQLLYPLASGCVYAPGESRKTFGFGRTPVAGLSALVLLWLWLDHPAEVVAAVVAAAAVEALVGLNEDLRRALSRRRGTAWLR